MQVGHMLSEQTEFYQQPISSDLRSFPEMYHSSFSFSTTPLESEVLNTCDTLISL